MNKKKIATLLLVGTLLVGGGALGAKAWFTSNANVQTNLKVTMGTLNLEAEDKGWQVLNTEANGNDDPDMVTESISLNDDYVNVRPGDDFIKNVTVTNTGSLKSRTSFKINEKVIPDSLRDKVTIAIKEGDKDLTTEPVNMNSQESKNIAITVKLDGPNIGDKYQGQTQAGTDIGSLHQELVNFLNSDVAFIDVSGIQVNAPKQ